MVLWEQGQGSHQVPTVHQMIRAGQLWKVRWWGPSPSCKNRSPGSKVPIQDHTVSQNSASVCMTLNSKISTAPH